MVTKPFRGTACDIVVACQSIDLKHTIVTEKRNRTDSRAPCQAKGCKRSGFHMSAEKDFYNAFCTNHIGQYRSIRKRINSGKALQELRLELDARLAEQQFRKYTDFGHRQRITQLFQLIYSKK